MSYLRERGFADDVITQAGLRVARLNGEVNRYGLPTEATGIEALFIPYRHANGSVAFERLRLTEAEALERFGGGKYRQPAGRRLALYDPFVVLSSDRPLDYVVLVEGELNALAIHQMAPGVPVVGLPGQRALTTDLATELAHLPAVYVWIDRHESGADQALRTIIERLEAAGVDQVIAVEPTGGLDAADLLLKFGEAGGELIDQLIRDAAPLEKRYGSPRVDLPERGLIREYVDCFEPTTEAPRQYHVALALLLVSLAIGPDAWIQLAGRLYLNLYVLILGPSAEARKSTAIGYGATTIRKAASIHPGLFREEWLLPSGTVSPEALLTRLDEIDRGFLNLDEFARLLAGAKTKSYLADVKEVLTEVYGCRSPGRLTRTATIPAGSCFLSIAAATTRSRLDEELSAEDVASGFMGRFLVVHADASDRVLPFPPAPDKDRVRAVVDQLAHIATTVQGEITFSPGARAAIENWYVGHRTSLAADTDAGLALPIFFRLDGIVRKLSALMEAAADPRPDLVISEQSARDAIAYADFVFDEIRRRLLNSGAFGDIARKLGRLRDVITDSPGIRKAALMKRTNIADPDFSRLTELLADEGDVAIETGLGRNKRGVAYRPGAGE